MCRTTTVLERVALVVILFVSAFALNAQEVDIQTYTNGQDADLPPGPTIPVGNPVNWTYVVTNTGSRALTNVAVTDDQGVTVTCPGTVLDAGESMTCTASGTAVSGQYANVGTVNALQQDSSTATDSDPSHYFGQLAPAVTIETRVNGQDADSAPGPSLPIGSTISWTYEVTNIGEEDLIDVVVTDSLGATVTCPSTTLATGASMTCTASSAALAAQRSTTGSVTATRAVSEEGDVASDDAYYYGQTMQLIKRTNGMDVGAAPGPTVAPGATVTWTYEVTNPGPATVTGLAVTDDQGVVVTCGVSTLAAGESVTCTGSGTAVAGQYTNVGTASANLPLGGTITVTDASWYLGGSLGIVKSTNGFDANVPPGPSVAIGSTVNWTYVVTNYDAGALTDVSVTDDQGVTVTCPKTTLASGESMTCTGSGIAVAGQYANIGTVSANLGSDPLTASDPSHYFGQTVDFGDAPDPTYPTLFASNGARHHLGGGVYLGACVDAEVEGLASAGAAGDDGDTGTAFGTCATPGDDEDGVTFTSAVVPGQSATLTVVASAPCTLSAWIDYSRDGDFGEANEELFAGGTVLVAGSNPLNVNVPAGASLGTTFARFRCTTSGAVGFTGSASDGEVEDYQVEIVGPPIVTATKSDALQNDVDGDGLVEPGDTIRYTIVLQNSGASAATTIVFTDTPDANTALVAGSVTTSSGSVVTGNTAGDTTVRVDVASLAVAGSVTITFDVVVDDPLPPGVVAVSNQGNVSGANFTALLTDDPAGFGAAEPTFTALGLEPLVTATKTAVLFDDADGDTLAEPGDTIRYTIVVTNSGDGNASAVQFSDTPDANTTVVIGSVTTTLGSVTSGNVAGDTSVAVNLGTLAANSSATIVFDVTIDPIASNVTAVVNSGTVTGSNIPTAVTDDPSLPGNSDATSFAVAAALAANVPTADVWALLALIAAIALVAARRSA